MVSIKDELAKIVQLNRGVIKDYKLIALFGSSVISKRYEDIDLITIGNDKNHKNFLKIIKSYFKNKGFKIIVFKTIKKKPYGQHKNDILVHDLHYNNIDSLLNNEWKVIIRAIKIYSKVIYGSKMDIPLVEPSKKDIFMFYYEWCREIKTKKSFDNFQFQIIKGLDYHLRDYPHYNILFFKDKILTILRNDTEWKIKKKDIIGFLSHNI